MDFKTFIANEAFDLDNIGGKLDRLFANSHFERESKAYLDGKMQVPSFELPKNLEIPQLERTGTIISLLNKRNPIHVKLSDGTEVNFTYDEWQRVEGEPAVGKVMTIVFQRHPADNSKFHSKIERVIVKG